MERIHLRLCSNKEITNENCFNTLFAFVVAKSVSSGFLDIENSDSKSSSIIYLPLSLAQDKYSCFLEALAETPLGKLR